LTLYRVSLYRVSLYRVISISFSKKIYGFFFHAFQAIYIMLMGASSAGMIAVAINANVLEAAEGASANCLVKVHAGFGMICLFFFHSAA
jgi:hypothetical protein